MRVSLLIGLLAVVLAGCGGAGEPGAEEAPPPVPTAEEAPREQAPTAPEEPPATVDEEPASEPEPPREDPIAGESLAGGSVGIDDFRDRYLFVNVWSSW